MSEKVELTPKEYDLLFYLVENKNIALSRDKLFTPAPPFTETTSMSVMILLQAGLVLLGIGYLMGLMTPKARAIGGALSTLSITKEA